MDYYFYYTVINVVYKKYNLHIKFKIFSLIIEMLLRKIQGYQNRTVQIRDL